MSVIIACAYSVNIGPVQRCLCRGRVACFCMGIGEIDVKTTEWSDRFL